MLTKKDRQDISLLIAQAVAELINPQFEHIESQMVTKQHFDDKLADLRAELMGIDKKQEKRMNHLVGILEDHRTLTTKDVKSLDTFRAFPSL